MNPNMGLARLLQPRSNMATNLLFAVTFMVFALIADVAIDQQRGQVADGARAPESLAADALGTAALPGFGLRALVKPYF